MFRLITQRIEAAVRDDLEPFGFSLLPVKRDGVALDTKSAEHRTERQIEVE